MLTGVKGDDIMGISRKFYREIGLSEEQIDKIMAANTTMLSDYVLKTEVQSQIDEAVSKAQPQQVNVTETDEYKAIANELNMVKTLSSEDFNTVKPKFKETVYKMLDTNEKHKPYSEQLSTIQEQYEEYFTTITNEPKEPQKPQFGANTQGQMPGGKEAPSFMDGWGFVKKKG